MRANFVRTVSSRISPVRRTCRTCRVRLVLAPLRVCAPCLRVAEIVTQRQLGDFVRDPHGAVRLGIRLVLERRDPGRRLSVTQSLPVCPPAGAEGRACGLVADHRTEAPVGREVGDEQLARPDVAARPLDEEAVPADRGLHDALHDARVLGRHEPVVRPEDDRMAGVVDDRGYGPVVVAVEADDGQRGVRRPVRIEPDGGMPARRRHAPVHRERRATRRGPDANGAHRRGCLARRSPDRLEDLFDIGFDELAVPADPGTAQLERDGHRMIVRRPDGDACHWQARGLRRRSTAPALPARRPGCRGRRRRSRRGHRPRPRRRPRRRGRSPTARGRSPPRSRGAGCPSPRPGSRPAV